MANLDLPPYALLSDAPPLKNGGHGCHVLAWNWIEAMEGAVKLVVTHRLNPALSTEKITNDLKIPVRFYRDLSRVKFPRPLRAVKSFFEAVLFLWYLPRVLKWIRASGAKRLFAFFGGNPWFLSIAGLTARFTELPLDVYLVDDLEESARQDGQTFVAYVTRWIERRIVHRADRVFAISHGYCEHLEKKYRVRARWLPIAIPETEIEYRPYRRLDSDVRVITFIGAVNRLYLDPLQKLLQVIEQWNATSGRFRLKLLLMTYTEQNYIAQELGHSSALELIFHSSSLEIRRRLQDSWVIFMPYSFAAEMRVMVSTSFPTKLIESLTAGRPILVCGPAYASVPRYFREYDLPLCARSLDGLETTLHDVEQQDRVTLIERYKATIRQLHSPRSLRQVLSDTWPGQGK